MSCPAHRTHLHVIRTPRDDRPEEARPVTDQDVRDLIVKALTEASGVSQWIDGRPQALVMETDGLNRVTVWDDAEPDDAPGVDYAITVTPLCRACSHPLASDGHCPECVRIDTGMDF